MATLSMYCSHQTCDHTNKSLKGAGRKNCLSSIKSWDIRNLGKLLSAIQWRGNSFSVMQMSGKSWHQPEGLFMVSWNKNYRPLGGRIALFQATLQQMIGDYSRTSRLILMWENENLWKGRVLLKNDNSGDVAEPDLMITKIFFLLFARNFNGFNTS